MSQKGKCLQSGRGGRKGIPAIGKRKVGERGEATLRSEKVRKKKKNKCTATKHVQELLVTIRLQAASKAEKYHPGSLNVTEEGEPP